MPPKGKKSKGSGGKKKAAKAKAPPALPKLSNPSLEPPPFTSHLKKISICIGVDDGSIVHYTTDGSDPTEVLDHNSSQQLYNKRSIIWKEGKLTLKILIIKVGFQPCFVEVTYLVQVDPWKKHPSPFGGRMSQNDEWNKLGNNEPNQVVCCIKPAVREGKAAVGTEDVMARQVELARRAEEAQQQAAEEEAQRQAAEEARQATEEGGAMGEEGGVAAERGDTAAEPAAISETQANGNAESDGERLAAAGAGAAAAKAIKSINATDTGADDAIAQTVEDASSEMALVLPEYLSLAGCEISSLSIQPVLWGELTALDLSGNQLTSDAALQLLAPFGSKALDATALSAGTTPAVAPAAPVGSTITTAAPPVPSPTTCWLRKLVLAGNRVADISTPSPLLAKLPFLLHLDLSQNPSVGASIGTADFSRVPLRALLLQNVGLSAVDLALPTGIGSLSALQNLDLSHNKLADLQELDALTGQQLGKQGKGCFEFLTHLNTSNNPFATAGGGGSYVAWQQQLQRLVPSLKSVDAQQAQAQAFGWGNVDMVRETMERSTAISLSEQDSSSCSCVGGNPCAVACNCRDWANRFQVARAAREEKYDNVF
jgi:hypothetical protein